MIFHFFAYFFLAHHLDFFSVPCCYFVSDDNMEIHTYWYSNKDLPSQTEAKNYVNTNVLTAKINHNPQATWISWGKRGKNVGWEVQLETSWSQRVEQHTKKSGNIFKDNLLVSHNLKISSGWKASWPTTTLHWKSFVIFGNHLCSLSGFL